MIVYHGTTDIIEKPDVNHSKNDLEYDQLTLNEYIDPFTGEPVKRQKNKPRRLSRWS